MFETSPGSPPSSAASQPARPLPLTAVGGLGPSVTGSDGATARLVVGTKDEEEELSASYLLQEASLIHQRVQWYLERHERLELFAIAGTGATWAFALSRTSPVAASYLVWLPVFTTVAFAIKSYLFTRSLTEAFDYLQSLEIRFGLTGGAGWVHNYRRRSSRYKRRWRNAFWTCLIASTALAAIFVPIKSVVQGGTKSAVTAAPVPPTVTLIVPSALAPTASSLPQTTAHRP